ncbi:MAG: helix-turn-helix domain-containing protein [Deltaproteobacteria bacterium]|jgi:hypothetical protein|nr:helix-turn-helix domain-containing protein [Deltaproteobacteria bacterium]
MLRTYCPKDKLYNLLEFTGEISEISGMVKLVYVQMGKHACDHDFTFVGQERLARLCSCSVRSVQRYIKAIEGKGLLRVKQEGKFKRYYFVIPDTYLALAVKCGIIGDKLSREISANQQNTAANASENSNIGTTHDNLSAINKNKSNTNTPLTPRSEGTSDRSPRSRNSGGGDSSNSSLEKTQKIQKDSARIQSDFTALSEAYPKHPDFQKEFREAFGVFRRMYDELPLIGELLACIEHEKRHNDKWQRNDGRWVTHLKNWLKDKQYQDALDFLAVAEAQRVQRDQRLAAAAEASRCAAPLPASSKPNQDSSKENTPEIPFVEAEFERCHELWSVPSDRFAKITARGMWNAQLRRGLIPTFADARNSAGRFASCIEWLKAFGSNQMALCGA